MNINDCYNFDDFRKLAKKKLPAPIFHYIDGGADDEVTLGVFFNTIKCGLIEFTRKIYQRTVGEVPTVR